MSGSRDRGQAVFYSAPGGYYCHEAASRSVWLEPGWLAVWELSDRCPLLPIHWVVIPLIHRVAQVALPTLTALVATVLAVGAGRCCCCCCCCRDPWRQSRNWIMSAPPSTRLSAASGAARVRQLLAGEQSD
eukprot:GHVU01049270.1.p3 GENE.GHVU01049270.1~~GHVU01049270.1.p3  ORF type:complete len:131 (-),score=9.27 GHVU01049270.1:814-1206(-)